VHNVVADSTLAMVAVSDTMATGLSSLFYLLMSHPECLAKAKAEVDGLYPTGENVTNPSNYHKLLYLTTCMYDYPYFLITSANVLLHRNETLRLLPPALTSGPRQVPNGSGPRFSFFLLWGGGAVSIIFITDR
jgi:cytochrome P450